MKHIVMPRLVDVAGGTAMNFPTGWRYPVPAIVRAAVSATGRKEGTVKVAEYGTVTISLTPKEYAPGEHWLDWEYTPDTGTTQRGRWQA